MSDALSDLSTDRLRGQSYSFYLNCLADLVANPSEESRDKTIEAAQATDEIAGGYFSRNTSLAACIEQMIPELLNGGHTAWAMLLASVEDEHQEYARFYELSPFRDVIVTTISFGIGFVTLGAELKRQMAEAIQSQGYGIWNCQAYVAVIPRLRPEDAEIIQVHIP